MRVASVAPAKQRKMKVGFFRSSSTDLGRKNIPELNHCGLFEFQVCSLSSSQRITHKIRQHPIMLHLFKRKQNSTKLEFGRAVNFSTYT